MSTSSPLSFESWSHHERDRSLAVAPIIGSWPVARNRLDFVRPGTVAGQISVVSVVVAKVRTRLRDSPDGTRVRETISRIDRRITLWRHLFVKAYGQSGPPDGPRLRSCISTRWSTIFRSQLTTSASLRGISTGLAYAAAETPEAAWALGQLLCRQAEFAKQAHRDRHRTSLSVRAAIAAKRNVTPGVAKQWHARARRAGPLQAETPRW